MEQRIKILLILLSLFYLIFVILAEEAITKTQMKKENINTFNYPIKKKIL